MNYDNNGYYEDCIQPFPRHKKIRFLEKLYNEEAPLAWFA